MGIRSLMAFLSLLPPGRTRRARPVLVLLASLVFVLTVLNVSTFARHVGMQEMDQELRLAAVADPGHAAVEAFSLGDQLASGNPSRAGMRLLHAVGACLLLIAAGAVLLIAVVRPCKPLAPLGASCRSRHRPGPTRRWHPPAFSPPALSPVLRT